MSRIRHGSWLRRLFSQREEIGDGSSRPTPTGAVISEDARLKHFLASTCSDYIKALHCHDGVSAARLEAKLIRQAVVIAPQVERFVRAMIRDSRLQGPTDCLVQFETKLFNEGYLHARGIFCGTDYRQSWTDPQPLLVADFFQVEKKGVAAVQGLGDIAVLVGRNLCGARGVRRGFFVPGERCVYLDAPLIRKSARDVVSVAGTDELPGYFPVCWKDRRIRRWFETRYGGLTDEHVALLLENTIAIHEIGHKIREFLGLRCVKGDLFRNDDVEDETTAYLYELANECAKSHTLVDLLAISMGNLDSPSGLAARYILRQLASEPFDNPETIECAVALMYSEDVKQRAALLFEQTFGYMPSLELRGIGT
jgi:hypothetical protein